MHVDTLAFLMDRQCPRSLRLNCIPAGLIKDSEIKTTSYLEELCFESIDIFD